MSSTTTRPGTHHPCCASLGTNLLPCDCGGEKVAQELEAKRLRELLVHLVSLAGPQMPADCATCREILAVVEEARRS